MLVKFNSSNDVQLVLSKRTSLCLSEGSPIYVKKDLSKEDRHLEQIVLKERRALIDSGVERSSIRVSGFKISVNSRSHGHAEASGFVKFPSLGMLLQFLEIYLTIALAH